MNNTIPIADCHIHIDRLDDIFKLKDLAASCNLDRLNIVSYAGRDFVNLNAPAFAAKAEYPDLVSVFAGLDHTSHFSGGGITAPPLADQIDRLIAIGADGVKMLEGKPDRRKVLGVPLDSPYFEGCFARLEETGFPVLLHVADPEEFWNPALTPMWAKQRGWGYDDTDIRKEQLYTEMENVLRRHPGLKIIFAHFYFLSADLPRAAALLERYPGVHFDLAPGIELLYNLSKNVEDTREFFDMFSSRILYGSDIAAGLTLSEANTRGGIVQRWLGTFNEFRLPENADFVLGSPEDGIIRGLSLSEEVLEKILCKNFLRMLSENPGNLDRDLAIDECKRLAVEVAVLSKQPKEQTEAWRSAIRLEAPGS